MVKQIITRVWCDLCFAEDESETPGEDSGPLLLPGMKKPKSLDLCDRHNKQYIEPLAQLLADHGKATDEVEVVKAGARKGSSSPRKEGHAGTGPYFCKVPGCTGYQNKQGYKTVHNLTHHARSIHGLSVAEYREQYGIEGNAPTREGDNDMLFVPERSDIQVFACDAPGCDVTYDSATNGRPAQALGVHKALKHGIKGERRAARSA